MTIEITDDFEIECLGEMEEEVYDIETDNTHMFFANDILIHNSLYLSLEKMVEEHCKGMSEDEIITWLDKFSSNEIQNVIDETFIKIQKFFGAPKNYMKMSREKVIMSAIWTAKKHYGYKMIIEDDNRLSKPKYGYKGLECIKSSTPKKIRELMKYTINSILDDKNISDVMSECKSKIMEMTPEEISFPRTCNGLTKYKMEGDNFVKGTPAHVKAGLVYNKYLKDNNITDYPMIAEGNKIRYLFLKEPNPLNAPSFAFINRLPKDENILKYVDYDTMYEKAYGKVITDMLEKIGLSNTVSDSINLDELF